MEAFDRVSDAIPLDEVKRVLVIKLRHHGDVLLAAPVFSALKKHAPQAAIDALVYADTAPMLTLHPAISEVHRIDRAWDDLGWFARLRKEWHLFSLLRAADYDLVIHLSEHLRGAWLARLLRVRWAVAPQRHGRRWKKSFSHRFPHPRNAGRHVVESNLDALRRIGIQPAPSERQLTLVPGREAEAQVASYLRGMGLDNQPFIHIHPACRWRSKCWPVEHMAALIRKLQADGHSIILTAAPNRGETEMVAAIQSRLQRPVANLAGDLNLKELAALTARSQLFIGVDAAPMHIAAAMGTPTVALFGPSGEQQWGPWGVPARVLTSTAHDCRPCGIDGCGGSKVSDCLVSVTPEAVYAAVQELLAR